VNWEAIGAIGELVGALVVILTVFYLARQVRENTEQARLAAIRAINASNDSAFNPVYIPENTRIWTRCHARAPDLDDHELAVFSMLMFRLVGSYQTSTYQFVYGAFDVVLHRGLSTFVASFLATPGGAVWWAENRTDFDADTQRHLDVALAEIGDEAA